MSLTESPKQLVAQRPAESGTGLAAAVAVIVCALLDVDDPNILFALTLLVGALPGAITWVVDLRYRKGNPRPETTYQRRSESDEQRRSESDEQRPE